MRTFDACVIGAGGVVGSAVLRDLARRGLSVAGVEKHGGPAQEASGLNSRVVHSGFHEAPGTLKAKLALAGSRMLTEYASRHGVPLLKTGMLIAVPRGAIHDGLWRELGSLLRLWRGGRSHGVEFQWILSQTGVRRIAPIEAIGGIFIPSVCVVDVLRLIACLQRDAMESGAEIRYSAPVESIVKGVDHYVVRAGSAEFTSRSIVNSAGLSATEISRMAGGPSYSVELIRGEYYELRGGVDRWNIRALVYPAMPSTSRSKGIHFGPRTDGRLFIGPNAVEAGSPPSPKELFLQAAQRFVPRITGDDLEFSCAGIRPKFLRPDGVSDFLIRLDIDNPPLVNLIGIDSPGLSASLAIAEYAGTLLASGNHFLQGAA